MNHPVHSPFLDFIKQFHTEAQIREWAFRMFSKEGSGMFDTSRVHLIYPKPVRKPLQAKPDPPLPVLLLAGKLKEVGIQASVWDGQCISDWASFINTFKKAPEYVGVSCKFGYQIQEGLEVSRLLKSAFPEVKIIWGGWFPSLLPDVALRIPEVDIIVRGPGESSFPEIIQILERRENLSGVKGVSYKEDGVCKHNPDRSFADYGAFQAIDYGFINSEQYSLTEGKLSYFTSRGCPNSCGFCSISTTFRGKWIAFPVDTFIQDLQNSIEKFSISRLSILDTNFFGSTERVEQFCRALINRGIRVSWRAMARIDTMAKCGDSFLSLLKESGCRRLDCGIESASSSTQKTLKHLDRSAVIQTIKRLNSHGIGTYLHFIAGWPGEGRNDFAQTVDLFREIRRMPGDNMLFLGTYRPVPGSRMYNKEHKEGKLKGFTLDKQWIQYAAGRCETLEKNAGVSIYADDSRPPEIVYIMSFYLRSEQRLLKMFSRGSLFGRSIAYVFLIVFSHRLNKHWYQFPLAYWLHRLLAMAKKTSRGQQ